MWLLPCVEKYAEGKKLDTKECILWFHLYESLETARLVDSDIKQCLPAAGSRDGGGLQWGGSKHLAEVTGMLSSWLWWLHKWMRLNAGNWYILLYENTTLFETTEWNFA